MRLRLPLAAAVAVAVCASVALVLPVSAATADDTTVLRPTADATVSKDEPDTNRGSESTVLVDGLPQHRAFLGFTVTGLSRRITAVRLRLHTSAGHLGSLNGGTLRSASATGWSERAITWNNQPSVDGATIGKLGVVGADRWYDMDITGAVTGNGSYTFVVESDCVDGVDYDARESGGNAPQLVLTTSDTAAGDPVLVGAADISFCGSSGDDATADLLAGIPGTVFTAGDNAQLVGLGPEYTSCFQSSWGRFAARTRPAAGNHDYYLGSGEQYYRYFGSAAGPAGKGYYAYDLGSWHIVVLNSNCSAVACSAGSEQERWLRADLAAHPAACTAAYWHHPLFTSGSSHTGASEVRPLYQALYEAGADVVVNGHVHTYERFARQDPSGKADRLGIRQFVVGTGGYGHVGFATPVANSEVRDDATFGVLKLTLHPSGYDWQFVPQHGKSFTDAGSDTCGS